MMLLRNGAETETETPHRPQDGVETNAEGLTRAPLLEMC